MKHKILFKKEKKRSVLVWVSPDAHFWDNDSSASDFWQVTPENMGWGVGEWGGEGKEASKRCVILGSYYWGSPELDISGEPWELV